MVCITDLQTDNKDMNENLGAVKAHAMHNFYTISELNEAIQVVKSPLAKIAAIEINKILYVCSPNGSMHQSTSSNPVVGVDATAEPTPAGT